MGSLHDVLVDTIRPAGGVLVDGDRDVTAHELVATADRVAASLAERGVGAGDRAALVLPNGADWFVAHLALARLGALTVPVTTRLAVPEIVDLVRSSRSRVLVVAPDFLGLGFGRMAADLLADGTVDHVVTTGASTVPGGCTLAELDRSTTSAPIGAAHARNRPTSRLDRVAEQAGADLPHVDEPDAGSLRGDEPGTGLPPVDSTTPLICFGTSGTTGAPKLAVHTHAGVAGHARAVADALGLTADDVVLGVLPPCGAYGYTVATAALAAGARFVPLATFTPADLLDEVVRHGASFLAVTEAILRAALPADARGAVAPPVAEQDPAAPPAGADPAARSGADLTAAARTWRLCASAGGSLADVVATSERAGVRVVNVYGASEVLALLALRDPAAPAAERAAAGGTLVGDATRVRAVVPGTDDALPDGQIGELQFRGPSVFTGYLDNSGATVSALTADGWYRSGDSGRTHDGGRTFDYLSRLADTLRLKDFLVDPAQIEETLLAHPSIREAQVVGIGDPTTGEDRAIAFVVGTADQDALRAWCRERLAAFKVPERIAVVDDIPVTPSANGDKALKRALRERALTLTQEEDR